MNEQSVPRGKILKILRERAAQGARTKKNPAPRGNLHHMCLPACLIISQSDQEGLQTIHLLDLLPTVKCASPGDVIAGRQPQSGRQIQCN